MKKISFLAIAIVTMQYTDLETAARTTRVQFTPKASARFISQQLTAQAEPYNKDLVSRQIAKFASPIVPKVEQTIWHRTFQDYRQLLPKYRQLHENSMKAYDWYHSVDTHPLYQKSMRPLKISHWVHDYDADEPFMYKPDYVTAPMTNPILEKRTPIIPTAEPTELTIEQFIEQKQQQLLRARAKRTQLMEQSKKTEQIREFPEGI